MITYKSITNPGDRKVNEDSVGQYTDGVTGLFIVADGLGGHGAGDIASHYVAEQFLLQYGKEYGNSPERYFSVVFPSIQTGLLAMQKQLNKDMKSTAAAVILTERRLSVCHIGDTRVYIFGKKKILHRTLDHSVPQMLANAGEIRERDIRFHPDRNRLLRAFGENSEIVDYDMFSVVLTANVRAVLICSDGFWEYITEKEMLRALAGAGDAEQWVLSMEETVRKNRKKQGGDNYSAIGILL